MGRLKKLTEQVLRVCVLQSERYSSYYRFQYYQFVVLESTVSSQDDSTRVAVELNSNNNNTGNWSSGGVTLSSLCFSSWIWMVASYT
jgi:hypothetical protein